MYTYDILLSNAPPPTFGSKSFQGRKICNNIFFCPVLCKSINKTDLQRKIMPQQWSDDTKAPCSLLSLICQSTGSTAQWVSWVWVSVWIATFCILTHFYTYHLVGRTNSKYTLLLLEKSTSHWFCDHQNKNSLLSQEVVITVHRCPSHWYNYLKITFQ